MSNASQDQSLWARVRDSEPHGTPRFSFTILVMMIPFVVVVSYWARASGKGTVPFDPTTLIETSVMNVVGLILIYGIGRTRLTAFFGHLGDILHPSRRRPTSNGDAIGALFIAAITSALGWILIWQTISPGAAGRTLTASFMAEVGTPQFYKSGFQTLVIFNVLAIFLYATVQHMKMSHKAELADELASARNPQLPVARGRRPSRRQQKALEARRHNDVVQMGSQDFSTVRYNR